MRTLPVWAVICALCLAKNPAAANYDSAVRAVSGQDEICVILKDLSTGRMLYRYDPGRMAGKPVPVGSLIKIFTVIAKYRNHAVNVRETHDCAGYGPGITDLTKCWLREGHGSLTLLNAIAFSCNSYFYGFSQDIDFSLFMDTLRDFGLLTGRENLGRTAFNRDDRIRAMIGKMNVLKIRPLDLMEGCAKLFGRGPGERSRIPSDVREVLTDGMRACYEYGTAGSARGKLGLDGNLDILCKTGTGVFEDEDRVYPDRTNGAFLGVMNGRYLVLVLAKNTTGADRAALAGLAVFREMIRDDGGGRK